VGNNNSFAQAPRVVGRHGQGLKISDFKQVMFDFEAKNEGSLSSFPPVSSVLFKSFPLVSSVLFTSFPLVSSVLFTSFPLVLRVLFTSFPLVSSVGTIPLVSGDLVRVTNRTDNGWIAGHRVDPLTLQDLGQNGWFPETYVQGIARDSPWVPVMLGHGIEP
jgi:hypothetical protein